jgi:hypothetical protein
MSKLIAGLVAALIVYLIYEGITVYNIFSKGKYNASFQTIGNMVAGEAFPITFVNHKNKKLYITGLTIDFIKNDQVIGGFKPIDVSIVKGENKLMLDFTSETKFVKLAADYAVNQMKDYKVRFSGLYLGFIPFRVPLPASQFIA